MAECGAAHPTQEAVYCTRQAPCFEFHQEVRGEGLERTNVIWPSSLLRPRKSPRKGGGRIVISVIPPSAGPAAEAWDDHVQKQGGRKPVQTDVPAEAVEAWSKEQWVATTTATFECFLRARSEDFTTAEDFWPLVDAPQEMRAMVLPVRTALKRGWITEVGFKRLSGVYNTRDGIQFPMNKAVPVYRSTICNT